MPLRPGDSEESLRAWLEELVTDKWKPLMGFVLGWTPANNPAAAQDVIQDTVFMILAGRVKLPDDPEKAWNAVLNTIRNVARNHHRTEEVRRAEPLTSVDVDAASVAGVEFADDLAWEMCRRIELREALTRAMGCLTDSEREVFELRYIKGLKNPEVARERECSTETVKKLLSRALAKLRVELDGWFGPK